MGTHLQSLKSNLQNKGYRITKPNQDHGKRAQGSKDVLSSHAQTSELQSYPVQKGQGVSLFQGRRRYNRTERLWWSDQAYLPQESEDDQEDPLENGDHLRKGQEEVRHPKMPEAMQVLRARW